MKGNGTFIAHDMTKSSGYGLTMQVVVEASGAAGLAAAMTPAFKALHFKHVGVILCGGNVDLDALWPLIEAKIPK